MSTLSNDPRTLSHEAYVYLYPLVTMEITRRQSINKDAATHPPFGPPNQFHHLRAFPAAEFRAVVRPNFDTLYSSAWIDLTDGPVVISTADTQDRYFMLPMLDMWTDVFANPGKRTTGTSAESFVLVPPGWSGDVPAGTRIDAPTAWVWVIGRTQTNGPADYAAVNAVQDGFGITPARRREFAVDPAQDVETEALRLVNGLSAVDFFTLACETMKLHPPHSTDFSILERISQIGIVPGESFDPSGLSEADVAELEAGAKEGLQSIHDAIAHIGVPHNGWAVIAQTIGVYGNAYLRRAAVALAGLGANPPEDAIYPLLLFGADGKPTTGDRSYVMHFDADKLPPVYAFWSITMYDDEGYQVPNELDRFAIGDRDALTFNTDGSLDIYLQSENPGPDRVANWLPSPSSGHTGITMRLYAPRAEALDGRWTPPPVTPA